MASASLNRTAVVLSIALAALTSTAAMATRSGVYKWIDDRGNIHYDDQSLLAERITHSTLADRTVEPEPEIKVPEDFVKEVKLRCTDFSERAQGFRTAAQLYVRDASGHSMPLNERQSAMARAEANALKTRFCRADAARLILMEERASRRAAQQAKLRATKAKR